MKIRLNLATAPLANNRRFLLGYGLLGIIGLVLLVVVSSKALGIWRDNRSVREEATRLESEMSDLRRERADLETFFKQGDTRQMMDRAAFLNGMIEQRAFPWTRVFMDLEKLLPAGVRVISISPRMQEGRVEVRLVVGAQSDELKQKFLENLDEAREFTSVEVMGVSHATREGESDRVQLELVAWYAAL